MDFDEDTIATQLPEAYKERSAGAQVHFCNSCQSVLRPKAVDGELVYQCPQCREIRRDIEDKRVYVNVLKRTSAGFTSKRWLSEDPTLPRREMHCKNCEAITQHVIFMANKVNGEDTMSPMRECTVCHMQSMVYEPSQE